MNVIIPSKLHLSNSKRKQVGPTITNLLLRIKVLSDSCAAATIVMALIKTTVGVSHALYGFGPHRSPHSKRLP